MTLRSQFVFFDFEQAPLSVFFEYFSIMGTCIAITNYYIKFLVIKKREGERCIKDLYS